MSQPGNFFGGTFFDGGFFGEITTGKTGTGGIDPGEGHRRRGKSIVKPTGTLHLPKKKGARTSVDDRVEQSREIQAEVAAKLAQDFAAGSEALRQSEAARELVVPIVSMPLAEMEAEIFALLQKKRRTEEEEIMLLMLMVSVAV